jgi:four helix bundle protein
MAKVAIQSFRDLEVWQAAMDLTVLIYEQAARLPVDERYALSSQIRRAGVSIPSNIAEGHSCGEEGRYIHHVRIALGSAGELSTELELIVRLKFASPADLAAAQQQLARTRQMLYGLLRSLSKNRLLKQTRRVIGSSLAFWLIGLALVA